MNRSPKQSDYLTRAPLSTRRKLVYAAVPTLALLLLLGVLEIGLRVFGTEASDDPYLNLQIERSIFKPVDRNGIAHLHIWHPQAYGGSRDVSFAVQKPERTFRVFCVGGSACAGWPNPEQEDFGDYLEHALCRAYPDRTVEVINVAAHGFASYRARRVFHDVVRCEPDAIILYSGNNEFLEQRQYSGIRAILGWSYLAKMASAVIGRWLYPENTLSGWGTSEEAGISDIVGKIEQISLEVRSDPEQLEQVLAHYAFCIEDMVLAGAAAGTKTYLVTVPSNLRDWLPNVSHHDLDPAIEAEWQSVFRRGRGAWLRGDLRTARVALEQARSISPDHAETAYWLGRVFEALGDPVAARSELVAAKDLDLNPFRALSRTNETLRRVAASQPSAVLVDLEAVFAEHADGAAPGFDLFLDYVHPTKRGNVQIARTLFARILEDRLVEDQPATREFTPPPTEFDVSRDIEIQRLLMQLHVMMHQETAALGRARSMIERIDASVAMLRHPVGALSTLADFRQFFTDSAAHLAAFVDAENAMFQGQDYPPDYRETLQRALQEFFFPDVFEALETKGFQRRN